MAILLGLFLCTCSGAKDSGKGTPADRQAPATTQTARQGRVLPSRDLPLAAHYNLRYTDDLKGLLDRRYIRVLTTFSKTNFFISGGALHGFEYALLREYERSLNKGIEERDLRVVLEFIPVPRDQIIPLLISGLGDIGAAGLTITPSREKQVAFTDPYLTDVDEVIVTNRQEPAMEHLDDLSGRTVYVRRSSSYHESLEALNREFRERGIPPVRIRDVDESLETEDILELVHSGALPITVADSHLARIWSRAFPNLRVAWNVKVRTGGRIAWMVRKTNPELRKSLNAFIRRHRKGTLLGNIYFKRYFDRNEWIRNPLSEDERKKQSLYEDLFKRYASAYGFDWMLIMALAYQESGLDPGKKSPSGAVGIMQVRPSTAADKNIRVSNVHLLENNIHAGVKYLAFLRDRYFQEKGLRERDRIRFSLAAYNAGPARIRKARRLAKEMGLDPNRWFRNVEIAVLRLVGQETVRYVSNINKYYVLLKLQEETERLRESGRQRQVSETGPRAEGNGPVERARQIREGLK